MLSLSDVTTACSFERGFIPASPRGKARCAMDSQAKTASPASNPANSMRVIMWNSISLAGAASGESLVEEIRSFVEPLCGHHDDPLRLPAQGGRPILAIRPGLH